MAAPRNQMLHVLHCRLPDKVYEDMIDHRIACLHIFLLSQYDLSYIHLYSSSSSGEHVPVSLIAQLVEHCTGIAEAMGSNPGQPCVFPRLEFHSCNLCIYM